MMRLYDEVGIFSTVHQWFCSYLTNRTQHVSVNQSFSGDRLLTSGVPRGCVLVPSSSPFTLGRITKNCDTCWKLFADDAELYRPFDPDPTSALTAVHTVQECFRDVKAWVTANKLKLNDEKTEAIICDSKASQLNDSVDSIHIGQSVIPLSDTVRDIGLFLDKTLLMTNHISSVARSCFFRLRCLGKPCQYLYRNKCKCNCCVACPAPQWGSCGRRS